jgi:hypothetical protein
MTHLRFSPAEYQAIARLCGPLDLRRSRPQALRRLLVGGLADALPELARRLRGFRRRELRVLHEHLRERQASDEHGLTPEEFETVATPFGPLLSHVRFIRPLKRAVARQLRETFPGLAAKLDHLSQRQFEALCEEIRERTRRTT